MNGCWDLKGNCSEILISLKKDILDGQLREIISHRALDYASEAAKIGDPIVFPKAHPIPLTHPPSFTKGAVSPVPLSVVLSSGGELLGGRFSLVGVVLTKDNLTPEGGWVME